MTIAVPRSDNPRVSVLIAAASTEDLLHACLGSLARHAPQTIAFETLVLLNDKTAGFHDRLVRAFSGVKVDVAAVNLGSAGAYNRLRSQAKGDYLIFLHDDATVAPDWMEGLVDAAAANPRAGAIGSKVLDPDGRLQAAGSILWRDGTTSPPWAGAPPAAETIQAVRPVDYCGLASLLVRVAAWDTVGGADEGYFPAYFVDVDLAMALKRHGWTVIVAPGSVVYHRRGSSTSGRLRRFVGGRNRRTFVEKWSDDLAGYDPPDWTSSVAVARALERAARLAADCVPPTAADGQVRRPAYDNAVHERRSHERNLALQRAYLAFLAGELRLARSMQLAFQSLASEPRRRIARTPRNLIRLLLKRPL